MEEGDSPLLRMSVGWRLQKITAHTSRLSPMLFPGENGRPPSAYQGMGKRSISFKSILINLACHCVLCFPPSRATEAAAAGKQRWRTPAHLISPPPPSPELALPRRSLPLPLSPPTEIPGFDEHGRGGEARAMHEMGPEAGGETTSADIFWPPRHARHDCYRLMADTDTQHLVRPKPCLVWDRQSKPEALRFWLRAVILEVDGGLRAKLPASERGRRRREKRRWRRRRRKRRR